MQLDNLRRGFLICALLWRTALCLDERDVWLGRRQIPGEFFEPGTVTVTVFTRYTLTQTIMITLTPTQTTTNVVSTPVVTVTSTERTTTKTTKTTTVDQPVETGAGEDIKLEGEFWDKRKRQLGFTPTMATITTTVWQFPDATETLTITATALQQPIKEFPNALPTTTTIVTTETSTVTTEQTVTASTSSTSSSPSATPSGKQLSPEPLLVDSSQPGTSDRSSERDKSKLHVGVIVGATLGAVLGAVILFAVAFLWAQRRHEAKLGKESCGTEAQEQRLGPVSGRGVTGILGSVLGSTRSTARYNTIPNADGSAVSLPVRQPMPYSPPPQLPPIRIHAPSEHTFVSRSSTPPQLPQLNVIPPSEHEYEYTFGSPVSSIGELQLHALTSGEIINQMSTSPPQNPLTVPNEPYYPITSGSEEMASPLTAANEGAAIGVASTIYKPYNPYNPLPPP